MKSVFIVAEMLCAISIGWAQSGRAPHGLKLSTTSRPTHNTIACPLRWHAPLSSANRIGSPA